MSAASYVVTGAGRGIGRAVVERLLRAGPENAVVGIEFDPAALAWAQNVTAKAAIEGLTRALAVEYGPRGIRVNAVAPASVDTERYAAYLGSKDTEEAALIEAEMRLLHPLGRVARTDEVAAAIGYLRALTSHHQGRRAKQERRHVIVSPQHGRVDQWCWLIRGGTSSATSPCGSASLRVRRSPRRCADSRSRPVPAARPGY